MLNFIEIEKKLNNDECEKKKFLENPVEYFKNEGITLTERMEENLKEFASEASSSKEFADKQVIIIVAAS